MWGGIKRILGNQARVGDTRIATVRAPTGKKVSLVVRRRRGKD